MTIIDTDLVLGHLRDVGADLCVTYWQQEPAIELDDMQAALRRIDGAAADTLRRGLAHAYPRIGWLEGETDDIDPEVAAPPGEYWICDAIDGAAQYVRTIPNWSMSLTLMREGVPVFAAVYDAMHDEMFHALRGGGAFRNGVAIRVNGRESHYQGLAATSQPPFASKDATAVLRAGHSLSAMLRDVLAVRNLGPTSLQLAYVACGRLDAFWEFGGDGYNCIGATLLIREAGGVVTQVDGGAYTLASASLAAASPRVHASMLPRLQQSLDVRA